MLPSKFLELPLVRQSNSYVCGVSCFQSIIAYYGHYDREDRLSEKLNCQPSFGTPHWNIMAEAEKLGIKTSKSLDTPLDAVIESIDQENPVLVAIQAWGGNTVEDQEVYINKNENGHYVVVVGYDDENVYLMDPSVLGRYTYIPRKEFEDRWHDIDQNSQVVNRLAIFFSSAGEVRNSQMRFVKTE